MSSERRQDDISWGKSQAAIVPRSYDPGAGRFCICYVAPNISGHDDRETNVAGVMIWIFGRPVRNDFEGKEVLFS